MDKHSIVGRCMQDILHLTMTVARQSDTMTAAPSQPGLLPLLQHGLARAASCAACNHKDVASNGMSCLSAIIGECSYTGSTGIHNQGVSSPSPNMHLCSNAETAQGKWQSRSATPAQRCSCLAGRMLLQLARLTISVRCKDPHKTVLSEHLRSCLVPHRSADPQPQRIQLSTFHWADLFCSSWCT